MAGEWKPGDLLTPADLEMLARLRERAAELGYTPSRAEVQQGNAIKRRFRTWGNAVRAAGLPWVNYPEQQRRRAELRASTPASCATSSTNQP